LWLAQCCPTAGERVDLTGRQFHQQGGQINEMANAALYTNGHFVTCSGFRSQWVEQNNDGRQFLVPSADSDGAGLQWRHWANLGEPADQHILGAGATD
jgi:hypothetical protein